jgi:hypothetical protein
LLQGENLERDSTQKRKYAHNGREGHEKRSKRHRKRHNIYMLKHSETFLHHYFPISKLVSLYSVYMYVCVMPSPNPY